MWNEPYCIYSPVTEHALWWCWCDLLPVTLVVGVGWAVAYNTEVVCTATVTHPNANVVDAANDALHRHISRGQFIHELVIVLFARACSSEQGSYRF